MSNKKNSDNKSNKKQNTKNMKINEWPRHGIQALWAFITNSHVTGFVTGKIYTGKLKNACVPGLNCYSCSRIPSLFPSVTASMNSFW